MPAAVNSSVSKSGASKRSSGYNHYGQRIGSKGERTRKALIASTIELLGTHGLREVSVADVARGAQTSPATFYVYFRGVPEVVLAALDDAPQTSAELEGLMAQDWQAPGALELARKFVDAYCDLWNRHGIVFRVRNLAAEEGDERFRKARMAAAAPIMAALTTLIERAQAAGAIPADLRPRACAGTILMMLERLSAVGPTNGAEDSDVAFDPLKAAAAFTLANMLAGRA